MRVLVVGSVLMDVRFSATAATNSVDVFSHAANARIGGAAYNVAVNLIAVGCEPILFTALRHPSTISDAIIGKISKSALPTSNIRKVPTLPEALFCYQLDGDGVLKSAMTSAPLNSVQIGGGEVEGLADGCNGIIADLSAPLHLLDLLSRIAAQAGIPMIVNLVSDSLVVAARKFLLTTHRGDLNLTIVGNENEVRTLELLFSKTEQRDVCAAAGANMILSTRGAQGHDVLLPFQQRQTIAAPNLGDTMIVSTLGAGDCFLAIVSLLIVRGAPIDWSEWRRLMRLRLPAILAEEGATPQSSI